LKKCKEEMMGMKRSAIITMLFILALVVSLAGCGGGSGGSSILLSDDFESYTGGPGYWPVWTATGNWVNISIGQPDGDGVMAIMLDDSPGGQGRFAKHTDGGWVAMVNNAFTGTNYTFSMKIKPGSTTTGLGLMGRYVDLGSYYYLQISNGNTLELYKMHGEDYDRVGTTATISYNTDTFYLLKLVFNGNQIIGYFENTSISYTDDGIAHGPVINSGKIGFGGDQGSGGGYDDVLVTK
jgi:hypothetical protein